MQTRALSTFVKIARAESFARVAENQNLTLSTVSMQIKSLEAELGVDLFDRSFRPPRLTPLGKKILDCSERLLNEEEELFALCQQNEGLSGTYHLGFIATASVRLLPKFLKQARSEAPLADFRVETALSQVLEERVLSGQLDGAVVTAPQARQSGLNYIELREERLVYALPGNMEHREGEVTAAQAMPFLKFNPSSGIGQHIEEYIDKATSITSDHTIILDSVEAIMECVNEGLGFTLLMEPDVKRYAASDVHIHAIDPQEFTRHLVLIVRQTLSDQVSAEFRKLLAK